MALRAVMAGCGNMSKGWLDAISGTPGLKGRIDMAGFVDLDIDAAKRSAATAGLGPDAAGTDLPALLAQTRAEILFDIVVPGARRRVVEAGLAAGCHVLSEKPMASSLADARALVEAARCANRIHAVVQNRRFNSGVRRIREFIDSGMLGELTALHCDFFIGAHFGGFRDEMENVLLLDMAIHTLDAARFMAGKTPLAVYCLETNPRGSWYAHGAAANALFEFSDDVVFSYRGSWCAEGANTSWEAEWRVIGTKGTLIWDGADGFSAHVVSGTEGFLRDVAPVEVPEASDPHKTQGHASVIAEFLDAIENGRPPETAGHDNINSLAMVFAAIESARSRRRVEILI